MDHLEMSRLSALVIDALCAACVIERDAVHGESSLHELGLDSMAITAIVGQTEATYECELSPDQIVGLFDCTTVDELIASIETAIDSQPRHQAASLTSQAS